MCNFKKEKKVSILVPYYKSGSIVQRCIDSLINQTYTNIEIVVVDDGSDEDLSPLKKKYPNVKFISHEKNEGLFKARITGFDNAVGDYIAFVDSDDIISIDWVRSLVSQAERSGSDIVIGDLLLDYGSHYTYFSSSELWQSDVILNGSNVQKKFFEQAGLDFTWHILCGKLYSREILSKAYAYLRGINEHIVMCEDVLASTIIWSIAQKVTNIHESYYYYNKSQVTSTSVSSSERETATKIENIIKIFDILERYFECDRGAKFIESIKVWRNRYVGMWKRNVLDRFPQSKRLIDLCENNLRKEVSYKFNASMDGFFYKERRITTLPFEEIKKEIVNSDIVSFDIFDTLVTRPFFNPSDIFELMDSEAISILGIFDRGSFKKIRINAEHRAREKAWVTEKRQEVTLDEIYSVIGEFCNINEDSLSVIKKIECNLEEKYCSVRKSAKELFDLAKYLGKKIYIISDMYLPEYTIRNILEKCGYDDGDLLLSSTTMRTKSSGEAYLLVPRNNKKCLHIGDNYNSDFNVPKAKGWKAVHFPRTIDVFTGKGNINNNANYYEFLSGSVMGIQDVKACFDFLGIRCMVAIVANKLFDNPYRLKTDNGYFDANSYFIGYFPLGMHLFSITKWLCDLTKEFDRIVFLARDGWLIKQAVDSFLEKYNYHQKTKYFYTSRKAVAPLYIKNKGDILAFINNLPRVNERTIVDSIRQLFYDVTDAQLEAVNRDLVRVGYGINSTISNEFIKGILVESLYVNIVSNADYRRNERSIKSYLKDYFDESVAVFDVGYSARLENLLKNEFSFNIKSFYIHTNSDIGYNRIGADCIETFYNFSPSIKGTVREWLMSECCPSCIGFEETRQTLKPIFEDYNLHYSAKTSTQLAQQGAVDFVNDMLNIFNSDLQKLHFRYSDAAMPFEFFLNTASDEDMYFLSTVVFEDNFGAEQQTKLVDYWKQAQLRIKVSNQNSQCGERITPSFINKKGLLSGIKKALYYWLTDPDMLKIKYRKLRYSILKRHC